MLSALRKIIIHQVTIFLLSGVVYSSTCGLWVHECETLICTFSVIIFLYEHLFPGFFPLKCNIFHVFSKYQPLVLTQCLLHNRCLPGICSMINLVNKWLNPRKKETNLETALNRSKPVVLSYWCLCPQRTYSSVWRQLLLGDGEGGQYYWCVAGLRLHTLQCTGQRHKENYLAHNFNNATAEKLLLYKRKRFHTHSPCQLSWLNFTVPP